MKELYIALNKVRLEVGKVHKGGSNPFTSSGYATLNDCWEAIGTKLEENDLMLTQTVTYEKKYPCLITNVLHVETGQTIFSEVPLMIKDANMQALGGAITYARRYSLVTILGLLSEDDDGNRATGRTS